MYFLLHRCLYCKLPTTTLNSLSKKLVNLQRDFKEESEARKQGAKRIKSHLYEELEQIREIFYGRFKFFMQA
jgi:hypothetical protein